MNVQPPCTLDEWTQWDWAAKHPEFVKRSRRFAVRLGRALADIPIQTGVAFDRWAYIGNSPYDSRALSLLVVHGSGDSRRIRMLRVWTAPHFDESEKFFGITPEYGKTHSHFILKEGWHGPEFGLYYELPIKGCQHYTRASEAIAAVKEWVMSLIPIPFM